MNQPILEDELHDDSDNRQELWTEWQTLKQEGSPHRSMT